MKLYTRKGDDGTTQLCRGPRVAKDDPHIEACGTVDELNSLLGVVRAESLPEDIDQLLYRLQNELFAVGAHLATCGSAQAEFVRVDDRHVRQLEEEIDLFQASVPPLQQFILPGGGRAAALLHVARSICRRAERRIVSLHEVHGEEHSLGEIMRYLNRLADLLFVLPRLLNTRANVPDEHWRKDEL